jgi:hypothetical protein
MKTIVLFDGQCHKSLLPLTFTRPVAHLRVGIFTISEKWSHFFGQDVHVRCKDYLIKKFDSFEGFADLGILAGLLPNEDLVDVISNLSSNSILVFKWDKKTLIYLFKLISRLYVLIDFLILFL